MEPVSLVRDIIAILNYRYNEKDMMKSVCHNDNLNSEEDLIKKSYAPNGANSNHVIQQLKKRREI